MSNASLANLLAEFNPITVTGYENNKTHTAQFI